MSLSKLEYHSITKFVKPHFAKASRGADPAHAPLRREHEVFREQVSVVRGQEGIGYFNSTVAPAASSFFLASSAAVLLMPVKTSFGALSTKSLASLRPKV